MSYAISRLHLESPPAFVRRLGNSNVSRWQVICQECQHRTKARELISLALSDWMDHVAIHRYDAALEAEAIRHFGHADRLRAVGGAA